MSDVLPADPIPARPLAAREKPVMLGWIAKYILSPLTPSIVGAGIRAMHAGQWSIAVWDPVELSFSLAVFCLIGAVSSRRLKDVDYRESAFAIFVIGINLFISLFALSVLETARLTGFEQSAITSLKQAASQGRPVSPDSLETISNSFYIKDCDRLLTTSVFVIAGLGLVYFLIGFVLRDRYSLGEDP